MPFCFKCNNWFESEKFEQYCGDECKKSSVIERREKLFGYSNCVVCNKRFLKKSNKHKCCSDECGLKNLKTSNYTISTMTIFQRDKFKCVYCGMSSIEDSVKLSIDHIIPIKKDGATTIDNLITSCSDCNSQKGSKILSEDVVKRLRDESMKRSISFMKENNLNIVIDVILKTDDERRQKFRFLDK